MALSTAPTRSLPQLSKRAAGQSSAIRDLLNHAKRPGMISLAGGLPDSNHFPTAELADIARRQIGEDGEQVLQYGETQGDEVTRAAFVSLFDAGTDADHIVVTTGSQQALDLIARVMINPLDQVVVGDPDYLGALQVFRSYGADIRSIAIDEHGLNTAQLEEELQWGLRPKCCYLVPNFHNPTGATISAARREHLNELSQRYGFLIIEDDPYRELYYDGRAPADALGDPELTVQLRGTSKTLAPGLRVGALAGPSWLTTAVVTAKQSTDLHTSSLTQAIVAEALTAPWLPEHLANLRSLYGSKRDVLVAALRSHFGDGVEFALPLGGMFVWARFSSVPDTAVWLERCLDDGVCFVPGAAFAISSNLTKHARLSFATGSAAELSEAVSRMAITLARSMSKH